MAAKQLSRNARKILDNVKKSMQDAEEVWGVDGQDYLDLMQAIVSEANQRVINYFEMTHGGDHSRLRGFMRR